MRVSVTLVVCFAVLAAQLNALPFNPFKQGTFEEFVTRYNKQYSNEEYGLRRQIFLSNVEKIKLHNSQQSSFMLAINELADLTDEEYAARLSKLSVSPAATTVESSNVAAPTSVDWRKSTKPTVVGPVRTSGQCNSIAMVVIDSIAGDYAVKFDEDYHRFDPSYVTNCTGGGCNGGSSSEVFEFVKKYGLQYNSKGCPKAVGAGICISGYTEVAHGNETALEEAVATVGPIVVAVDASHSSFQLYKSGIYYEPACSSSVLDHGMLLVGYGTSGGQDYWILRNTWGSSWGMAGDMLLARNKHNACGVASAAMHASGITKCPA